MKSGWEGHSEPEEGILRCAAYSRAHKVSEEILPSLMEETPA